MTSAGRSRFSNKMGGDEAALGAPTLGRASALRWPRAPRDPALRAPRGGRTARRSAEGLWPLSAPRAALGTGAPGPEKPRRGAPFCARLLILLPGGKGAPRPARGSALHARGAGLPSTSRGSAGAPGPRAVSALARVKEPAWQRSKKAQDATRTDPPDAHGPRGPKPLPAFRGLRCRASWALPPRRAERAPREGGARPEPAPHVHCRVSPAGVPASPGHAGGTPRGD